MRRVPLFLRAAVVCSSLTMLLTFVAMKAGAFRNSLADSSPEPTKVMMPGTKSANLGMALEIKQLENATNNIEKAATAKAMLMPSTKRAEVFDSTFPAKPTAVAPVAPPVTLPSTKSMAPAINFSAPPAPPSKAIAPQTTKGKGY